VLYTARAAAIGGVLNPISRPGFRRWCSVSSPGRDHLAGGSDRSADVHHWSMRRGVPDNPGDDAQDGAAAPAPPMLVRSSTIRLPGVKISTSIRHSSTCGVPPVGAVGRSHLLHRDVHRSCDKLFRGSATTMMLLRFFYYQTPQFLYYIIPIAVLVATARDDRRS